MSATCYVKAASVAAALLTAGLLSAHARAGSDVVVCNSPEVARDLVGVIERPEVFSEWLHGYLESGYCVLVDAERLGLRVLGSGEVTVARYAIVLPESRLQDAD